VRTSDNSVLPEPCEPLKIHPLGEKEDTELADALLQNTNVTYLELDKAKYTKKVPQKQWPRTCVPGNPCNAFAGSPYEITNDVQELKQYEEMLFYACNSREYVAQRTTNECH
jgi:hypothetical protein